MRNSHSCKKSNDNHPTPAPSAPMTFTANGTVVNFNTCIEADVTLGDTKEISFSAANLTNGKAGTSAFSISITHDPATIKAGQTYPVSTSFTQLDGAILTYFVNDSETDVTQVSNAQGSVTITDVSSTVIKGTFSCKLFDEADFDGKTVTYTITNGSFSAKRAN